MTGPPGAHAWLQVLTGEEGTEQLTEYFEDKPEVLYHATPQFLARASRNFVPTLAGFWSKRMSIVNAAVAGSGAVDVDNLLKQIVLDLILVQPLKEDEVGGLSKRVQ